MKWLTQANALFSPLSFIGMASQVTVCPPHVYQPQTSAFCRAKKIDPSSCVYHGKIPRTYVVGVNLGIAHPTDIIPLSRIEALTSEKPCIAWDVSKQTDTAPQELLRRASSPYKRVASEGDLQYFSRAAAVVEEESGDGGQNSQNSSSKNSGGAPEGPERIERKGGLNSFDGTPRCGFKCKGAELWERQEHHADSRGSIQLYMPCCKQMLGVRPQ